MNSSNKLPDWTHCTEIELSYRPEMPAHQRPAVRCSHDAFTLFQQVWSADRIALQEEFKVLLLNKAANVLGLYHAFSGGIDSTITDVRLIFTAALKAGATTLMVAHNHPSGKLQPSKADEVFTHKLKEVGNILDIRLLDHLIITIDRYFSFADEGLL